MEKGISKSSTSISHGCWTYEHQLLPQKEEKEASISLSKGPLQSISLAGKTNKQENREEKERGKERWRVSAEKDAFFCDFDRGAHLGSFQRSTHHFSSEPP